MSSCFPFYKKVSFSFKFASILYWFFFFDRTAHGMEDLTSHLPWRCGALTVGPPENSLYWFSVSPEKIT